MDKVTKIPYEDTYKSFIDSRFTHRELGEYYFRNKETKMPDGGWRHLRLDEIESLKKNGNRSDNWDNLLVAEDFDTDMIRNNCFLGLVRIGTVRKEILRYHDLVLPVGITNSRIISCDIGNDVAIHDVDYIANYIIGDECIFFNVHEMFTTDHSKFGNGIVKEGEPEDVRVWIDVMNESGGRKIMPFDGMITSDAYIWAKYVDDKKLQERLGEITQNSFDKRRGYYGIIGRSTVIKNSWILKDAKIGSYAYIKGANKLKNVTINSSEEEPTQIGEGVILVNGIIGYGCHIFYSVIATRFVIGRNCNLKYGARVIYSVLGDNSTISCCEILNNLIFPSHEQHHNNSFLISACLMGQSNIAAGTTLGSNHNSRVNDGEIVAGRGFWPGLCVSIKHPSKFASYTLLSKANYSYEMNIVLPFSLVNNNMYKDRLEIMPGFWWMYNMYALVRNKFKYAERDIRKHKIQNINFRVLAPDTVEEIIAACKLLEVWTAKTYLRSQSKNVDEYEYQELRKIGRQLLENEPETVNTLEVLGENMEKSNRKVLIIKPYKAYHAYHDMILYYFATNVVKFLKNNKEVTFNSIKKDIFCGLRRRVWINVGGQLMMNEDVDAIRKDINEGILNSWEEIHNRYNEIWKRYPTDLFKHACLSLFFLLQTKEITKEMLIDVLKKSIDIQNYICEQVFESRKKDYDNPIRNVIFRNEEEKIAVLGKLEDNTLVKRIEEETKDYDKDVKTIIASRM